MTDGLYSVTKGRQQAGMVILMKARQMEVTLLCGDVTAGNDPDTDLLKAAGA